MNLIDVTIKVIMPLSIVFTNYDIKDLLIRWPAFLGDAREFQSIVNSRNIIF